MTENQIRAKVTSTAIKYLGCNGKDGSHKKIIDIYNAHKPLARSYQVKYTDAWCATFVSAVSILCKFTDIVPTECSCGQMINLYKKLGTWKESDSYSPKPGDVIFYDWDDSGKGDDTGNPDHVGIVVSVSNGTTIKVIEGNKNDQVAYRTIAVNGKYIRGYGLPNYESKVSVPWYDKDQKWVIKMGISDGTKPEERSTRAELWAMLHRLYDAIKAGK